jgi:hypothetical protein
MKLKEIQSLDFLFLLACTEPVEVSRKKKGKINDDSN